VSITKPTPIRLTPEVKARLLVVAERTGAGGYAGGVRAALVLAERSLGISKEKPPATTATAVPLDGGPAVVLPVRDVKLGPVKRVIASHRAGPFRGHGRDDMHPGRREGCKRCEAEKKGAVSE
jgi:hypothetical protein